MWKHDTAKLKILYKNLDIFLELKQDPTSIFIFMYLKNCQYHEKTF